VEEEEKNIFTPDEEAIIAYLGEDEPLPSDVLEKLLKEWWMEEPYK